MGDWSLFREVDVGREREAAIHLADLLSASSALSSPDDGTQIFPHRAAEVFAKGRYRSNTIRPYLQYVDCDIELVSGRSIRGRHPPTLCIGVLLRGRWQSLINGQAVDMPKAGVPAMLAAGETFEAITRQSIGQRCRMAALNIGAEFFSPTTDDDDALFRALRAFLKPGYVQHEFPNCGILTSILQRLYNNPYQGRLGRLYTESLALSAIVELAAHIQGGNCRHPILASHHDQAYEAREILDQDIVEPPSIRELARRVGMSEVSLRRLFKVTFGVTIVEYLRDRKLDAARIMLAEGRLQVGEIAYRVGYADQANFTTAYRRRFGYPPTAELKRLKI
ncbi:helix-turn-helix transcriptional regulator (plasmid) [Nitrobacteraceae bacterium UC4446_H13]